MTASSVSALREKVRGCLNDRDGLTFNGARRALDELCALASRAESAEQELASARTSGEQAAMSYVDEARARHAAEVRAEAAEKERDEAVKQAAIELGGLFSLSLKAVYEREVESAARADALEERTQELERVIGCDHADAWQFVEHEGKTWNRCADCGLSELWEGGMRCDWFIAALAGRLEGHRQEQQQDLGGTAEPSPVVVPWCRCCVCNNRKCFCDHPGHDHRNTEEA